MKNIPTFRLRPALLGAGLAALLVAFPANAAAINATPEAASAAMDKAIVAGDGATLDALIAPDVLWIREGGKRTDKDDRAESGTIYRREKQPEQQQQQQQQS